ncbi:dermonecrotic toxin domain-containing protein [Pseudomonas frederiksbergensis]|uniref:dermonecrotic toxin domain-containing protein n=1 Tax=Pseudomonas frederiksbergensis TaxID=104087 RepID=UPI003D004827
MSNESAAFPVVHEKLIVLNETRSAVAAECELIPTVSAMLRALVQDALNGLGVALDVNDIYINKVTADPKGNYQPVGSLFEVVGECLARRLKPQYTIGVYGVFNQPGSTSQAAQIKNLSIYQVEKLIEGVLTNLVPGYDFHLKDYWATAVGKDAQGRNLLAPKDRLEQLHGKAFWAELEVCANIGMFTAAEQVWINKAYLASSVWPQAIFNIALVGRDGTTRVLASAFAIQIEGANKAELLPVNDGFTCALYLPGEGLRKFVNSSGLHQYVASVLKGESSRKLLLDELPVEVAGAVTETDKIRFFNIAEDLFKYCTTKRLEKQALDIAHYWKQTQKDGHDFTTAMEALHNSQRPGQWISQGRARAARYLDLATRHAWPQWLKGATPADQQRYVALEKAHLQAEVDVHERGGDAISLRAYAHSHVEKQLFQRTGTRIDPDQIVVTLRHVFRFGAKKIEHEEKMSLTELSISGLHNKEARFQFKVEGPRAALLSQGLLESVIETLDLRVKYLDYRRAAFRQRQVTDALIEKAGRLTALSVFGASLQNHLSPAGLDVVQRCNLGDRALTVWGLVFRDGHLPFKDLLVYGQPDHGTRLPHVLYAPGAPNGQDWFEFANHVDLMRYVAGWCAIPQGLDYLIRQSSPADQIRIERELKTSGALEMARKTGSIRLVDWMVEPGKPSRMSVQQAVEWADQAHQVSTPEWFQKAPLADRQAFARLHTEHKAIFALMKEKGNITPFQTFARDLVKRELNRYLQRSGAHPELDPDQVNVKLDGHELMTLTQLFINWEVWRSDTNPFIKAFSWVSPAARLVVEANDRLRGAVFTSRDGKPLARLNAAVVTALIGLLPGDRYIDALKNEFLASKPQDRSVRAALYGKLKQNKMQKEALVQRIKGQLSQDRYNWLKSVLDQLDVENHTYPSSGWAYKLFLKGKQVEGAYRFIRTDGGRPETIIYLPGSPEGKIFRSIEDFAKDIRDSGISSVILECVRLEDRTLVKGYLEDLFRGKATLELSDVKMAVPALHYEYVPMVERFIADVDHQTTSFSEAFWRDTMIVVEFVADVASLFIPPVGLVAGLLKSTRAIVRGIGAYNNGDEAAANGHFAAAWVGLISLYLGKVSGVGGIGAGVDIISKVNDYAGIISTATGVTVGASYLTYVASQTGANTNALATSRIS